MGSSAPGIGTPAKIASYLPPLATFATFVWAICIWRFQVHPPVGTYVAILGFLAAAVTIWPPENRWNKACWVGMFFGMMLFEIHNLYKDRTDHDKEQVRVRLEEAAAFAAIANGLSASIQQSQEHFDVTMSGMTALVAKEEHTAGLASRNLEQLTGGTGFVYIDISSIPVDGTGVAFHAVVHGPNIVRHVSYAMSEGCEPSLPTPSQVNDTLAGRLGQLHDLGDMTPTLSLNLNTVLHPPQDATTCYRADIFALNGAVHETLRIRYDSDKARWTRSLTVGNRNGREIFKSDWYK